MPYTYNNYFMFKALLIFLFLSLLHACASTSHLDYPRVASTAFDNTQDTKLGQKIVPLTAQYPGKSAFYLLSNGVEALAARLLLADSAERSIDCQYYLLHDDVTSFLFINSLLKAADRGVRVRILLDDITTAGYDKGMAALDSHPNIQLRVFNPFTNRKLRIFNYLTDLDRINHRMHNKSFTVDNQITIVGGRNIGDEYFGAEDEINFGDLDVIGAGSVAKDVSKSFDEYWNNEASTPVLALVEEVELTEYLNEIRMQLDSAEEEAQGTAYGEVLNSSILELLEGKGDEFIWAHSQVVADPPEKIEDDFNDNHPQQIRKELGLEVFNTTQNLFLVSPYFVPRDSGVEVFAKLRERGVQVTIITNSLSSNDVPAVHAGYSRYRKALLKLGVNIWEVRVDKDTSRNIRQRRKLGYSQSSLHAKTFAIDDRHIFIGSFNWDPRSARINTELGIYLDSPDIVLQVKELFMKNLNNFAYKLRLNNNKIEWLTEEGGEEIVFYKEPNTSLWSRIQIKLFRLIPLEDQL